MVTGCCTLILLQLWSSQSPPAIFLCSDVLLVYLVQQTWGFISFFLRLPADTCCKIFCKSGMCRSSLLLTWCCVSLGVKAVPLLCLVCSSTCCCSTWSPPLWLFGEKATPLYFQHPLILCISTQKLKFYSKAWNFCKNGTAGSRGVHGPRAACPRSGAGPQELCEIRLSISNGFLINAFTNDRTCAVLFLLQFSC